MEINSVTAETKYTSSNISSSNILYKNIVLKSAIDLLNIEVLDKGNIKKFPASFAGLRFSDPLDVIHHQVLLEHISKADAAFPGGSRIFIELLGGNYIPSSKEFLTCGLASRTLVHALGDRIPDDISKLCCTARALAGPSGKIQVEKSINAITSIELKTGSEFPIISPSGNFSYSDVSIALIDGLVENISELERLLQDASVAGTPLLLVARGFSDDVIHTVGVNLRRGTLSVRLIIAKFDENGINLLRDAAIVTGSNVVTSDTGSLISSLILSELSVVSKASVMNGILTIESQGNESRINDHVSSLLKKLEEPSSEFSADLIAARVNRLSTRKAIIRLADTLDFIKRRSEVDECLKLIANLTQHGELVGSTPHEYVANLLKNNLQCCTDALNAHVV